MPFQGEVVVRQVDALWFCVVEPLRYIGRDESFTVEPGFMTDFASVPKALVWLLPRYGVYTPAAILHDHLWRTDEVSRRDADGLFRRAMGELGVSLPRRWAMWAAVRLVSGMRGATALEWFQFLLVLLIAVPFVAIPAVLVQFWVFLAWLLEAGFWVGGRLLGRQPNTPSHPVRT